MTIQVYGGRDTRAIRVYWMLEELNVNYESVPIDFSKGEHRTSFFREINPAGKVPALRDEAVLLFESAAILTYLAEKYPDKDLLPKLGCIERAEVFQWMFYGMSELEQPLWTNAKHKFALPKRHRIPEMKEVAQYEWRKACEVVDQSLKGNEFIVGNKFSMADIIIGQTLLWGRLVDFQHDLPRLDEYATNLARRDALKRARR